MRNDNAPMLPMPIKVKPYAHQITAFNFVCKKLGLLPESAYSSTGYGAALLMEMGERVIIVMGALNVILSRVSRTLTKYYSYIA